MKISELIALLERDKAKLGDRELLEGAVFGLHKPFRVEQLLDGDHLGYEGKAVLFLLPLPAKTEVARS